MPETPKDVLTDRLSKLVAGGVNIAGGPQAAALAIDTELQNKFYFTPKASMQYKAESTMRTIKLGPLAISDETLLDILDTAGYGIGYWADAATIDRKAKTYTVHEQEPQDDDGKGVYVIPFDKLHETFWRIVAGEFSMGGQVRSYFVKAALDGAANDDDDIEAGHIDSDAADVLVQIAAFGEIVYG